MRLVWAKDKRIAGHHFGPAVLVANSAFSGNYQIQFPLRRVRVVREIGFSRRHSTPFQIKRMTFGQVERCWLAAKRFRNSFEGGGVFSARRLPRVLFDFVKVNLFHGCKSPQRWLSSRRKGFKISLRAPAFSEV